MKQRGMSRRGFVKGMAASIAGGCLITTMGHAQGASVAAFLNIERQPDAVTVVTESDSRELKPGATGRWENGVIQVTVTPSTEGLSVLLEAPSDLVKALFIRWNGGMPGVKSMLGDHWERAYGDLCWAEPDPKRVMPWYFLAYDGACTHGYGVRTMPSAWCSWTVDAEGVALKADVRCGGKGVELKGRALNVCTVVCRKGEPGESPDSVARAFCKRMCPTPRLADHRIYGFNDWYCTYGAGNSAGDVLQYAQYIVSLSPAGNNRPYMVLDAGWHVTGGCDAGPWYCGNDKFPSMPGLAADIVKAGARPGIWIRPLASAVDLPKGWRLSRDAKYLDPTIPEVRDYVATDMARLRDWGYQLIKHDFTTFDLTGRWGFDMGAEVTSDGWAFANRGLTTVEVITDLYRVIRKAAGNVVLLGCNTISHLSAGLFESNRIGDDTSGKEWARTRKMGVNCLAFRNAHHDTFYAADADCMGLTSPEAVPWEKNRQWLDLLARSGTVVFVSVKPGMLNKEQEAAVRDSLALSASPQPLPRALDWMETNVPRRWALMDEEVVYDWS